MKNKQLLWISLLTCLLACNRFDYKAFVITQKEFIVSAKMASIGDTLSFFQGSIDAVRNFEWSFGDNTQSIEPQPRKIYQQAGKYTVKLIRQYNNGRATDTAKSTITIFPRLENALLTKVIGAENAELVGQKIVAFSDGYFTAGYKNNSILQCQIFNLYMQTLYKIEITDLSATNAPLTVTQVVALQNSGFLVAGYLQHSATDKDAFLVKIGEGGAEEWRKIINTTKNEWYHSVFEMPTQLLVLGGSTQGTQHNLLKHTYSLTGNLVLAQEMPLPLPTQTAKKCADGGYLLSGLDGLNPAMIKLNSAFATQWTYKSTLEGTVGMAIPTEDGGYVMVGSKRTTVADSTTGFALKINATGNTLTWQRDIQVYKDKLYEVAEGLDNSLTMVGESVTPLNRQNVLVTRLNANGSIRQIKLFGGLRDEWGQALYLTPTGETHIIGTTNSVGDERKKMYWLRLNTALE